MADTALERYKKDKALQEESKTPPGEIRNLDEFQTAFLKSL